MKLYEKAIKGKVTVGIRAVRFNNIGLPRSGKTSFRRRLMGEIINILRAMSQSGKVESSTGIAESSIQIIRTVCLELGAILSTKEWVTIKDFKEEICMLNQLIHQVTLPTPTSDDIATDHEAVSVPHDSLEARHADAPDVASVPGKKTAPTPIDVSLSLETDTTSKARSKLGDDDVEEMFSSMKKAMEESDWVKVKYLLEDLILIINTDTGGQAEFLDLHASLISGPSFNLFFSRLVDKLDSMFKIYYPHETGISTPEEDSTMTIEEVMFQALASVACFSGSFSSPDNTSSAATAKINYLSKVMFVGTHRDLVSDEEFKERDDILKERIKDTELYKKDMIEFASEDHLMFAVNNLSGHQDEIDRIRQKLEVVISNNFEKIEIPVAWLVLSFCIRYAKHRTISLQKCEELAGKLNIGPEELQEALWFLHHCVGLLLYYPELDALKGTVICDIQVVFDAAYNLIKNTFTFDKVGQQIFEKFTEKAHFTQTDLEKAALQQTDSLLPLQNLVKLLEHLSILTPLPHWPTDSIQEPTYFMPCVLKSARASELTVTRSNSDPAPLMLRYQCGYVPVGVFPAMITNLVSHQKELGWEMVEKGLRKNRVQFQVGRDFDTVTLISHPRYFEVVVVRKEGFEESTNSLCVEVLRLVESTLSSITSRMNYNFSMGYKLGFECPVHSTKEHLCILVDKTARRMECLQDPNQTPLLKDHHSVWFATNQECSKPAGLQKGRCGRFMLIFCYHVYNYSVVVAAMYYTAACTKLASKVADSGHY